jgi:hypothetical protein
MELDDDLSPVMVKPKESDELVTVATFDEAVSASFVRNLLDEAGIPAVIADQNSITWDWMLSNALHGIKVQVNASDAEAARQMIEEHDPLGLTDSEAVAAMARSDDGEPRSAEPEDVSQQEQLVEDEPAPSLRERDADRALRGAMLGLIFPPLQLYVSYLIFKVFVSEEPLGKDYRNKALAASLINAFVLGGAYLALRPGDWPGYGSVLDALQGTSGL